MPIWYGAIRRLDSGTQHALTKISRLEMTIMSSTNSADKGLTIVAAAAGSAILGAVCAVAVMKMMERSTEKQKTGDKNVKLGPFSFPATHEQPSRTTSFIFNEDRPVSRSTILFPHNHEEKMKMRISQRVAVEQENSLPRRSVTVKVPATTANMGPGYDTLGMAVDLWNEITVERSDKFEILTEGEGAEDMPLDDSNYLCVGVTAAFKVANKPLPTLKYTVISNIPYARGLGSSSAAIVAGIIAGLVLAGHRLPCWGSEALLQIAADIEGHPDNVAPVIYGGIQLGIHNGTRWTTERLPIPPGLQLVMFIPDFIGKTSAARAVLGPTVTREEASFNIGRVAFLVNALCQQNLDNLKFGVQDKLHQPQRGEKLYTYLFPMIEAAENAGACCAYLSGAGPTVMAITSGASGDIFTQREKERTDWAVAQAMLQVADEFGIKGKLVVTQASYEGAKVVKADPPFSTGDITFKDNI